MSAHVLLEDTFPHGTVHGHRQGCKTNHCPAPITCAVFARRYAAEWRFRKRVDAGWTVEALAEADAAETLAAREAEKAAKRAEREAARVERAAARAVSYRTVGKDDRGRTPQTTRRLARFTAADIALLRQRNAEGVSDVKIGAELGRKSSSIQAKRAALGLPAIPPEPLVHGTTRGYNRGCRTNCPGEPTCTQAVAAYRAGRREA